MLVALFFAAICIVACGPKTENEPAIAQVADTLRTLNCDPNNPCFTTQQCTDTTCQNNIAYCHKIDGRKFKRMVDSFPNSNYSIYTVAGIKLMLDTLNCHQGDFIEFTDNTATNKIQLIPIAGNVNGVQGNYSIAFFHGLFRINSVQNNDIVQFHKAMRNNQPCCAIKIVRGNAAIAFSDYSGSYP
jgi:hypothetical protein